MLAQTNKKERKIKMQITNSQEEYIKTIYILSKTEKEIRVTDIANKLKITKPSVNRAIKNLAEIDLIQYKTYGEIKITEKGKQQAQFAQLFSRIKMSRYYSTLNITDEDVHKLFPAFNDKETEKEIQFLSGVCKSKWGIRGAVNVYENSLNNEDISFNGLFAMARTLGIEVI